ncbi:MAG TPA: hypothetical protein VK750_02820 [Cytophagaceae bacterium]|nr:hypothetical protein [Cytophagaceae bacterium]
MKYRLIKIQLLFCLVMGLSVASRAQAYEPAFIISVYGDTIRCQLRNIKFINGKTEYRYKKDIADKKDLFINANDVLWIITAKDTFECLATDKGLYKGQVYAYRLVVNGRLRLYRQDRYLKIASEVTPFLFIKKEGMVLQELSELDYKKYLTTYTADAPDKGKIEYILFKEEDIERFVKDYNERYQK